MERWVERYVETQVRVIEAGQTNKRNPRPFSHRFALSIFNKS